MKSLLKIIILILSLNSIGAWGKLSHSIDRTDIGAGETFVLDIQVDNAGDVSPDLSLIPSDFTIVSNSQYQHTQIVNGRRTSIKGWKIKLKTLKSGEMVIPPIPVGNEFTEAITLFIKESSFKVDINGEKDAVFLRAEIDQKTPYVQQQVIFTVSLYRSIATHYENLSAPQVENSVIEKLGEDAVFDSMINNRRYNVYQRKYVIFPQQSGKITIGSVNFTADVNDPSRQSRSLFLNSTRPISVSTQPIMIDVKPKPANADLQWLPAQNLLLADRWSNNETTQADAQQVNNASINNLNLKVGEPVTWTIMLSVQGLSESQLPEINLPEISGLQIYPDAPRKERQVNEKGIFSQRIEKFAVIPSSPGPLTIPSLEIKWWNTKTNRMEIAKLPPRNFNVQAADPSNSTPLELAPTLLPSLQNTVEESARVTQWQSISAGLLFLWLITLVGYLRKKGGQQRILAKADDHSASNDILLSREQALKKATAIAGKGTAVELEKAILLLVNTLGIKHFHSIGAVKNRLSDQGLIEKLAQLEAALYSASQQQVQVEISSQDLQLIITQISQPPEDGRCSEIPPLYAR